MARDERRSGMKTNIVEAAKEISVRRPGKPVMPVKKAVEILRARGYTVSQAGASATGAKGGTKE
jgi:hypothetical protein